MPHDKADKIQHIHTTIIEYIRNKEEGSLKELSELLSPVIDSNYNFILEKIERRSLLSLASMYGRHTIVEDLLEYPEIRNNVKELYHSGLVLSVIRGHHLVVKVLLKQQQLKKFIAEIGGDPLFTSCTHNNCHLVTRELLQYEFIRGTIVANRNEGLKYACGYGFPLVVKELLNYQVVIDNIDGRALELAARGGHLSVITELLKYQAVIDNIDSKALELAAGGGHLSVVTELLKHKAVIDNIGSKALELAAGEGHLSVVRELLKHQAVRDNVAANNNIALELAVNNRHFFVAKELLKYRSVSVKVAVNRNKIFELAAKNGHFFLVKMLLEHSLVQDNISINNNHALKLAADGGHLSVVTELLEYETVRDEIAIDDNEALILAARNGHILVVRKLLEYQAVRDQIAINNNEALFEACKHGHIDVVRELLKYQKVREQVATNNNRAFFLACTYGHADIIKELLKYQSVRDLIAINGNRELLLACDNDNIDVVKELLEHQVVRDNIDNDGNLLFSWAFNRGYKDVAYCIWIYMSPQNREQVQTDRYQLMTHKDALHAQFMNSRSAASVLPGTSLLPKAFTTNPLYDSNIVTYNILHMAGLDFHDTNIRNYEEKQKSVPYNQGKDSVTNNKYLMSDMFNTSNIYDPKLTNEWRAGRAEGLLVENIKEQSRYYQLGFKSATSNLDYFLSYFKICGEKANKKWHQGYSAGLIENKKRKTRQKIKVE